MVSIVSTASKHGARTKVRSQAGWLRKIRRDDFERDLVAVYAADTSRTCVASARSCEGIGEWVKSHRSSIPSPSPVAASVPRMVPVWRGSVPVSVVRVRQVRVIVNERVVLVCMAVRLATRDVWAVLVPVVRIVLVQVLVCHRVVRVLMVVTLA